MIASQSMLNQLTWNESKYNNYRTEI